MNSSGKYLLSGNEAIALGAKDAGAGFAAAYPGTPSTEILETITVRCPQIAAEWSVNEKVALEAAIGASLAGVRSLAAMKHVGLNVAADALMTVSYTGLNAGLVIISADDPNMYSSQNEQDNRYYARFAKVPMLEPSDSAEAYLFTRLAFNISEQFDTLVILRITTRIAHSKGLVKSTSPDEFPPHFDFKRDPQKYVMIPAYARIRHQQVENRMTALTKFSDKFEHNIIEPGNQVGVITSGIEYNYVKEAAPEVSVLKLAMTYPLPGTKVAQFAQGKERLMVIESLDPFLEDQIKAMGIQVMGKELTGYCGELDVGIVRQALTGKSKEKRILVNSPEQLPPRLPVMCPGCGHRGVFYVLKKLNYIVLGDIGCYTLGVLPPLEAMDTCICMGASIGVANGVQTIKQVTDSPEKVVAVIGDSTFIHAGIPALINAVYNKRDTNIIILDNSTTAMTGLQAHPGTGETIRGESTIAFDYEKVIKAIGVNNIAVVDPLDIEKTLTTIESQFSKPGVAVIIARAPCIQLTRTRRIQGRVVLDREKCSLCQMCLQLGCPALSLADEAINVDEDLCTCCGLCAQVCKLGAITLERQSPTSQ